MSHDWLPVARALEAERNQLRTENDQLRAMLERIARLVREALQASNADSATEDSDG